MALSTYVLQFGQKIFNVEFVTSADFSFHVGHPFKHVLVLVSEGCPSCQTFLYPLLPGKYLLAYFFPLFVQESEALSENCQILWRHDSGKYFFMSSKVCTLVI